MVAKFALVLLLAVAVNCNPYADSGEWTWIHKRLTVSPNFKALPFEDVVKSVVPQKPKYPSGTVKVDGCGTSPGAGKSDKIVGGTEATPHEFPWQAALYIDGLYFCGGSLISDSWIMTAAHCMDGAGTVTVVLGAHDLSANEASQETVTSTSFFVHEDWSAFTLNNDIAMIELPSPVSFTDYIQPVCLPSGADLGAGVTVTPSGWGKDSDGIGGTVNILRKVDVPTTTTDACADYYGSIVDDDMLCIDASGGMGTCNGDSGGPLNHANGGVTETRGITSFGSSAGCESGAPDSFTRVNHYLGWIQDNTGVTV